jgi:hypothetical protein
VATYSDFPIYVFLAALDPTGARLRSQQIASKTEGSEQLDGAWTADLLDAGCAFATGCFC